MLVTGLIITNKNLTNFFFLVKKFVKLIVVNIIVPIASIYNIYIIKFGSHILWIHTTMTSGTKICKDIIRYKM